MRDEIKKIKSDKKALREFGFVMAAFFLIIGGIAAFRGKAHYPYLLAAAAAFGAPAVLFPTILLPLQKAWMALSIVIGFFMSRIIMTVLFYAVLTPIGVIMRMSGKDVLGEKISKGAASYWTVLPKAVKDKHSCENQF